MNSHVLKYKFTRLIFVAIWAFIFAGCDEDSVSAIKTSPNTSSSTPNTSSSSAPPIPYAQSIIHIEDFSITPNSDKTEFFINGTLHLDKCEQIAYTACDSDPTFTEISFKINRIDEDGEILETPIKKYLVFDEDIGNQDIINFAELDAKIIDTTKTECGHFRLTVIAFATSDNISDSNYDKQKFIFLDSTEFTQEQEYCSDTASIPPPQPASRDTTPFFQLEGSIPNQKDRGFSFTLGEDVAIEEADIAISVDENDEITLKGLNGFKVAKYTNDLNTDFEDDWFNEYLPQEPAHPSDFRFRERDLKESFTPFDGYKFLVAVGPNYNKKTSQDFYALTVKERQVPNSNGDFWITIIYYQVE